MSKYEEALERARKHYRETPNNVYKAMLEQIFPDIEENEDKKIKEEIINYFRCQSRDEPCRKHIHDKWISWLEKQGDKDSKVKLPTFTFDDIIALQCCMETVKKVQEDKYLYEKLNDLHSRLYDAYHLKKQDEKKPNPKGKSALEAINEVKLDNANKIEPKFKVGDWIVQDNIGIYKIVEVCESWYEVIDNQNNHYSIGFDKEYMCHLWTMQDAKDGDTLVDEDNNIGIYKEIDSICWHSYIYLGYDNCLYGFNIGGYHMQNSTKPATREQRDNLFKKINEAGYVWYPNSKELYKLIRINYD